MQKTSKQQVGEFIVEGNDEFAKIVTMRVNKSYTVKEFDCREKDFKDAFDQALKQAIVYGSEPIEADLDKLDHEYFSRLKNLETGISK